MGKRSWDTRRRRRRGVNAICWAKLTCVPENFFRRFVQQNNVGGVVVGVKYACLVNSSDFDVFFRKSDTNCFKTIRFVLYNEA